MGEQSAGGHTGIERGPAAPTRQITLFDATSIIIGIVIGSGLYETVPLIVRSTPGVAALMACWIAGGLFALIGALCYAELATAYPEDGGDYVFLSRAYGSKIGFLFAWSQLWVIRPGSIGAMAFVFARYASQLCPLGEWGFAAYALGAVAAITAVNLLGLREGTWTQNALTLAKVAGLASVFVAGMLSRPDTISITDAGPVDANLKLAMILVLFTYGGWNDLAYVAAEVRDPQRNILRALLYGVAAIAAIYVLVNAAFVHALGFDGAAQSQAVAADAVRGMFGHWGARGVSALVCISALGAINGMILTGARIYFALGKDNRQFAALGTWSRRQTPVGSLTAQAAITLAVMIGFGLAWGSESQDAFGNMVVFTLPLFWTFLLATGTSLFALRRREPGRSRPFRVPLYPLTPLAFCGGAAFMLYASLEYAVANRSWPALWSIGCLAVGAGLAAVLPKSRH